MSKPSKNLISVTQENLLLASKGLAHFDLFEDRAALEDCLNISQVMVEIIEEKREQIRCASSKLMSAGSQSFKYVLIGPHGIGKTKYSAAIADALGVTRVLDDGYDFLDDLESAFVENTLLISNQIHFEPDANTIVFRVKDTSDLLLLVKDLQSIPFDPSADGPDYFKGTKIGDIGAVSSRTLIKQVPGHVIGVYPGSIRVRWPATDESAFETTFLRKTGMAKRAQLRFYPANSI